MESTRNNNDYIIEKEGTRIDADVECSLDLGAIEEVGERILGIDGELRSQIKKMYRKEDLLREIKYEKTKIVGRARDVGKVGRIREEAAEHHLVDGKERGLRISYMES
jgi:hypothetical protein